MPVGRRRKPFSTKQKKEQLQAKRERKRNKDQTSSSSDEENGGYGGRKRSDVDHIVRKLNEQPLSDEEQRQKNRFNLHFLRETKDELKKRKKDATKPLQIIKTESELELEIETIYKPDSALDIPIRPKWSYDMSKDELEEHEHNYFQKYLEKIFDNFSHSKLSYFEMNLETWRQLWRVTEMSDIILFIVDIRYPVLHFSPIFYRHVTETLKKSCILVFNKVDLVPCDVVIAWKHYFKMKFPNLHIVIFTSQTKNQSKRTLNKELNEDEAKLDEQREAASIYCQRSLYDCVKSIVKDTVNLDSWLELINTGQHQHKYHHETHDTADAASSTGSHGSYVTIGCCGFPNVGKSSLLNAINRKKVVSVSRTPGHTKHLQTIFLTPNVRLCDCPGLVFPSLVDKPLQILAGIYPIAQLQEPYSTIRYLSERIPTTDILKIKHPSDDEKAEWTPIDICEAWAQKRRYFTAKAARPDVYRAANELLRMALDGRLCLYLRPKGYSNEKDKWSKHEETQTLIDFLHRSGLKAGQKHINEIDLSDNEENDDESNQETRLNEKNKVDSDDASSEDEQDEEGEGGDDNEPEASNRYALLSNISND